MKKLVIFDLDGTLLNTIHDLAQSTNFALAENGFPTHEVAEYNYFVGNGINKLFERTLPEGERTEANIARIREKFLIHYDQHNADKSRPYEGIPELLETLDKRGILLAVASNKYNREAGCSFLPTDPFLRHIRPKGKHPHQTQSPNCRRYFGNYKHRDKRDTLCW